MPPKKLLPIHWWPDDILTQVCPEIQTITDEHLELAGNMLNTLEQEPNGIGLAAPQVGSLARIFVMKVKQPRICINPVIVKTSKGQIWFDEGCLSFPGETFRKRRYKWITVEYTELDGTRRHQKLFDLEAICFQHELDHLNGIPDRT